MKQYIFLYCATAKDNELAQEYKIEASGMLDAMKQAKTIKSNLEKQTFSNIQIELKGIVY